MAVRHGYGKIAGTDALVFAYDTGDTRNSYRGEPTTNLAVNPTFSSTSNWVIASNGGGTFSVLNNYGKITAGSTGSYSYVYQTISTTVASNENITWSIEFKNNVVGDYAIRVVLFLNGTPKTQPTTFFSLNGTGGTVKKSVTASHVEGGNSIRIDILQGSYYAGINTNNNLEFTNAQLERNSHATPFVNGTRSSTQGLLDLTGKGTINLTNTSFDANAQPFFDGVDDRIVVPYSGTDLNGDPLFTVEGIFKRTGASMSGRGFWGIGGDVSEQGICGYTYSGSGNNIAIDLWGRKTYRTNVDYPLNQYVHVVWVKSAPTFTVNTVAIYINGVEYTGASLIVNRDNAATVNLNTGNVGKGISIGKIGPQTNTYYGVGEVPVFKVYNRVLTIDEIRNNYRNYKTRFNL